MYLCQQKLNLVCRDGFRLEPVFTNETPGFKKNNLTSKGVKTDIKNNYLVNKVVSKSLTQLYGIKSILLTVKLQTPNIAPKKYTKFYTKSRP